MSALLIESTFDTPEIEFNSEKGYLKIDGKSIPEDSTSLYQEVIDHIQQYSKSPKSETVVDFRLEYFNTSSSKSILEIIRLLRDISLEGNSVEINWKYDEEDEEILEAGNDFSSIVNLPFNYIVI